MSNYIRTTKDILKQQQRQQQQRKQQAKDQKKNSILGRQGSFALLRCFKLTLKKVK